MSAYVIVTGLKHSARDSHGGKPQETLGQWYEVRAAFKLPDALEKDYSIRLVHVDI